MKLLKYKKHKLHTYKRLRRNSKKIKSKNQRTIKAKGRFDEVSCLIHATSFPNFIQILTTGIIKANTGDPPRMIKGNIETLNKGAFFQLVLKCDDGVPLDSLCMQDVILVFSKNLLEHQPYHITNNWAGGMVFSPLIPHKISPLAKSYNDVNDYIADNIDKLCHGSHSKNEVVFNEHVPIDFLIEVWICNLPIITKQINTLKPDGSYDRKIGPVDFNPDRIKIMTEKALFKFNKIIPVKVLNHISEINE
jgi:hypothetical protein